MTTPPLNADGKRMRKCRACGNYGHRPTTCQSHGGLAKSSTREAQLEQARSDIEDEVTPRHLRAAFLLRADQAIRFATYSGPVSKEVIEWARMATGAWATLTHKLEKNT